MWKKLQYFRQLKGRLKAEIFTLLLILVLLFGGHVLRSYCWVNKQITDNQYILQQQHDWLLKRSEISNAFDYALAKIQENDQNDQFSLLGIIEECISRLNCRYELSDEVQYSSNGITISKVKVNMYNATLDDFVHLSATISSKNSNISEVSIHALKDGYLNIKCLIESIQLVRL